MTGVSDFASKNFLNYLTGQIAVPATPSVFLALFTAVGTDAGTGFTEVTGGSYARVQVAGNVATSAATASGTTLTFSSLPSWVTVGMSVYDATTSSVIPSNTTVTGVTSTTVTLSQAVTGGGVGNGDTIRFSAFSASSGSAPASTANNAVITFPQSTASWGTAIAFGLYDALTSGNLLVWDYLGNYQWLPCTVSSASPGILTAKAHGYVANDPLIFSTEYGGTAPTFSQSNFSGVLLAVSPTTDTFSVTNAATAVNTSSTGSGSIRKILQQVIANNTTVSFAASQFNISMA